MPRTSDQSTVDYDYISQFIREKAAVPLPSGISAAVGLRSAPPSAAFATLPGEGLTPVCAKDASGRWSPARAGAFRHGSFVGRRAHSGGEVRAHAWNDQGPSPCGFGGDGTINAGILSGFKVVVAQRSADDGQIVVAPDRTRPRSSVCAAGQPGSNARGRRQLQPHRRHQRGDHRHRQGKACGSIEVRATGAAMPMISRWCRRWGCIYVFSACFRSSISLIRPR